MTPERPIVDVGVVTWNTRDLATTSLRRLLDSDQGCEIRLLVRDNGSTDGTPEAVARLVPEALLDHDDRNLGFSAGMNSLLRRSTAPWFLMLNPDAWPEPGAIGALVAAARAHPRAAAVAPRIVRPDGSVEYSAPPFPSLKIALVSALGLTRWLSARRSAAWLLPPGWGHDRLREIDWAVGAALLVPRQAMDAVGPLDESFFMYAEDLEWCWRARQGGWTIWFEPSAVVCHVGNASGEQAYGARRERAHIHNSYRFYRRHHGPTGTLLYRGLNLLGALRVFLAARLRGDTGRAEFWRNQLGAHWRRLDAGEEPARQPAR